MKARAKKHRRWPVWPLALLWLIFMAPLLRWGLPDTSRDELLFGGSPAWHAERYQADVALEQRRTRRAGADVDLDPLDRHNNLVPLTATHDNRAEILRRYRLFSRQPDEMITFMALQRMNPRQLDFDPKLYQYGGGFIYAVAGALAFASTTGLINLTSDAGVYLEHPEAFAGFYIVARLLVLTFGALLLVAAWKLGRRAGSRTSAWLALLFVAATPVFISGVLEAKPHVPSACLALWATLSALDYHSRRRLRDAVRMGAQAGYAFGLVLTGLVAFVLWPVLLAMCWPRTNQPGARKTLLAHLALTGLIGAAVFLLTNPYIPYNLLFNPASLESNITNSTAMYADQIRRALAGAARVTELTIEAAGWSLPLLGVIGFTWLLRRRWRPTVTAAAPGLAMLAIAILLGAGKPAEYARFLILPVSLLAIAAAAVLGQLARARPITAAVLAIVALAAMKTAPYLRSFITDLRGTNETRHRAALYLRTHAPADRPLGVLQEPAPYAVPPVDFAHRDIVLIPLAPPKRYAPRDLPPWLVYTADDENVFANAWWRKHYARAQQYPEAGPLTPITWANKPVFIYRLASDRLQQNSDGGPH